jgi:hypothetical protein
MNPQIDKNIIRNILEIQNNNPNVYIGGSISLILQGVIPYREIHDVDLIYNQKIQIHDIFNTTGKKSIRNKIYYNGIEHELFVNKDAKYINFDCGGLIIKLSPINETIEWKKIFYGKYKKEKHLIDLKNASY